MQISSAILTPERDGPRITFEVIEGGIRSFSRSLTPIREVETPYIVILWGLMQLQERALVPSFCRVSLSTRRRHSDEICEVRHHIQVLPATRLTAIEN